MNKSKVAIVVSQIVEKIEMILGGLWFAMMALVALVSMFDKQVDGAGTIIFMWVLAALGVWVFLKGRRRRKMRIEFKNYVSHLSAIPTGSLENIAAATGTSVDVVKKNLKFMIKKKFFSGAYLDEKNNQLVLPSMANNVNPTSQNTLNTATNHQTTETVYKTFNCPNCGGMNKIVQGTVTECDFCGSPLQG